MILIKVIDFIFPFIYFSIIIYIVASESYIGLIKDDIDYLLNTIPQIKRNKNNR